MGYRESLKFGIAVAVLFVVGVSSAAGGYSFGYLAGYDLGFAKAQEFYRGWQPPGEPIDWDKVQVPDNLLPGQSLEPQGPQG